MITINNVDMTEFEVNDPSFNFAFSEFPGKVTYAYITTFNLILDRKHFTDPLNENSPLYPLTANNRLPVIIKDNDYPDQLQFEGEIKHALLSSNKEIQLIIEDKVQQILNKKMVLANYEQLTPIEILRNIVIGYGIGFDNSNYNLIRQYQEDNGMIFDFNFGTLDDQTVTAIIDQLCKAGFMRACIYNSTLYVINQLEQMPSITILPQEVHSLPGQNQQNSEEYNSGSIKLIGSIEIKEEPPALEVDKPYDIDYSTGILQLNNPSGALTILDLYINNGVGRYYNMQVEKKLIKMLRPGEVVSFPKGVLSPNRSINARLIGRNEMPNDNKSMQCTFEVFL